MNAIAWAMWASWWRGALLLAAPVSGCAACGRAGHIAANCPYEIWRLK